MTATANDFRRELGGLFRAAGELGFTGVEVEVGNLHRRIGGYPEQNYRMPVSCEVMRKAMNSGDSVTSEPKKQRRRFPQNILLAASTIAHVISEHNKALQRTPQSGAR